MYVCICMFTMHVGVHCVCVCVPRLTSSVFLNHFPPLPFEAGSHRVAFVGSEVIWSAGITSMSNHTRNCRWDSTREVGMWVCTYMPRLEKTPSY